MRFKCARSRKTSLLASTSAAACSSVLSGLTAFTHLYRLRDVDLPRSLDTSERNKVRASYNRAKYLDERRAMMQQWADLIEELAGGDKVKPMKQAKNLTG